jgi:acetyltransferase-like isoleucine patch superfamily enzyme
MKKEALQNKRLTILLYSTFSYFLNFIWLFFDLLPHFFRVLLFRLIFKRFGRNCLLDYRCFIRYPWRVSVGNNVAINRGCELYPSMQTEQGLITLEDHVALGPNVTIFSSGHDYSSLDLPNISAPVFIGRYTWVGGGTIILPGVSIGEGAVIGAGSVVTKDIPAYTIAVGNPAQVIKHRVLNSAGSPLREGK